MAWMVSKHLQNRPGSVQSVSSRSTVRNMTIMEETQGRRSGMLIPANIQDPTGSSSIVVPAGHSKGTRWPEISFNAKTSYF